METSVRFLVLSAICIALIKTASAKAGALPEPDNKEAKAEQQEDKEEELEALSSKLADYDTNEDGILYYEEFSHAIMSVHNIKDPSELRGLFELCDKNGDEQIDEDEFKASPLADDGKQSQVSQFGRRHCHWRVGIRCSWFFSRRICRVYYYIYCH